MYSSLLFQFEKSSLVRIVLTGLRIRISDLRVCGISGTNLEEHYFSIKCIIFYAIALQCFL